MNTFIPSFNNRPLETAEDMYKAYVDLGKLLFDKLQPTKDEIKHVNFELFDIGFEDVLCDPYKPEQGGDIGFLACNIYEHREAVKAELEVSDDNCTGSHP